MHQGCTGLLFAIILWSHFISVLIALSLDITSTQNTLQTA